MTDRLGNGSGDVGLADLERAGYCVAEWSRWQQGGCLDYARALLTLDPALRLGTLRAQDGESSPITHYFGHDATHAYDSAGRHPLPYLGVRHDADLMVTDDGDPDDHDEAVPHDVDDAIAHIVRHGILAGRFGPAPPNRPDDPSGVTMTTVHRGRTPRHAHRPTCQVFDMGALRWCITHLRALVDADPSTVQAVPADITGLDVAVGLAALPGGAVPLVRVEVDREHAMGTDLGQPVLLVDLGTPERPSRMLVDGWHRVFKARSQGVTELPGLLVGPVTERAARIPLWG